MRQPYFKHNTIVWDIYWKFPVGIVKQWYDSRSMYKHGWYYDVEVADGECVGLKYTSHEDSFVAAPKESV